LKKRADDRSLDRYLAEIKVVPLISQEEEQRLARRIKQGDKKSLNKLVEANLRFVVSIAKQYHTYGMEPLDLINEGNIGLMIAAQRFDETKGFKFISYAVWWIRQSILKSIAEQAHMVRMPLNRISDLSKSRKVREQLEQDLGRLPDDDEVAAAMGLDPANLAATIISGQGHLSLDNPFGSDGENNLLEVLEDVSVESPEEASQNQALKKLIEMSLAKLSEREGEVLRLYFGIGESRQYTLEEIGEMYQLTRERVRQIKEKAIRRLQFNKDLRQTRQNYEVPENFFSKTSLKSQPSGIQKKQDIQQGVNKENSKNERDVKRRDRDDKLADEMNAKRERQQQPAISQSPTRPEYQKAIAMGHLDEAGIVLMATSYLVLVDQLPAEQMFSLIRYYGFGGDPPLTWKQASQFEISIIEKKELALATLSKLSGDSYEKLRVLFNAFRQLKLAYYNISAE